MVAACLEKDASRRIASAAELAVHLAPFASPEGVMLAGRIERVARGLRASQSLPPPPLSRPPGSIGRAAPLSDRDTAVQTSGFPPVPASYPSLPAPAVV